MAHFNVSQVVIFKFLNRIRCTICGIEIAHWMYNVWRGDSTRTLHPEVLVLSPGGGHETVINVPEHDFRLPSVTPPSGRDT